MADRWEKDEDFVSWLKAMDYVRDRAGGGIYTIMSDGVYLYMWESWRAGIKAMWTKEVARLSPPKEKPKAKGTVLRRRSAS